jgi:hypothetical protein
MGSSVGGGMVAMVVRFGGRAQACCGISLGVIQVTSTCFSMLPSNAYRTLTNILPSASKQESATQACPPYEQWPGVRLGATLTKEPVLRTGRRLLCTIWGVEALVI